MLNRIQNALLVCRGLFTTDKNAPIHKRAGQLLSRFLWELPNTVSGLAASLASVLLFPAEVSYKKGSTYTRLEKKQRSRKPHAITFGSFIVGTERSEKLLPHEYGHTVQSRKYGPLYLMLIALPSFVSMMLSPKKEHNKRWYEKDADRKGKLLRAG